MQVTLTLPDSLAAQIIGTDKEPSRALLEAAAAEAYRAGRLGTQELRSLLCLSRYELDGFLKAHDIWIEVDLDDFDKDKAAMEQMLHAGHSDQSEKSVA